MAAALLLSPGQSLTLEHVPRISDVDTLADILSRLGVATVWADSETLVLTRTAVPSTIEVPADLTRRIRGSLVLLGPLVGLYPSFALSMPGGDRIGGRPIGAHVTALADLGVHVARVNDVLECRRRGAPRGGTVVLVEQSVTATLLLLLYSAFLAPDDHLTIVDAACEPHIVTLAHILTAMGAVVQGTYSSTLTIRWPQGRQTPAEPIRLDDDFMEATTYAIAAAITHGDVTMVFANAGLYLHLVDRYLGWMGVRTELTAHTWRILGSASTLHITPSLGVIKAEPWPRFPTDVMSMAVVLATQCTGTVKFVEYMYDDRFGFVQSLRDVGAHITVMPPHAIAVDGPTPLVGNELFLRPDIRSGAAMLLAALVCRGTTVLHDRGAVIERGYQDLPQTLAELGARISAVQPTFF